MQSTVHLFNIALGRLGGEQIPLHISPHEEDATGVLCANLFPHVLELALSQHDWSFVLRRVRLAELPAEKPANTEYRLRYAVPADCLKPIRLDGYGGINRYPEYIIESGGILTNEEAATLVYVSRVNDPKMWPPAFADALAWGLAGELASARLNDTRKQDWCYQNYKIALAEAITKDLATQNRYGCVSPWNAVRNGCFGRPDNVRER